MPIIGLLNSAQSAKIALLPLALLIRKCVKLLRKKPRPDVLLCAVPFVMVKGKYARNGGGFDIYGDMKVAKVALVTGAYGFIGRYMSRFLAEQGWEVVGLGHGSWSLEEREAWGITKWHACDITLDSLLTYAEDPAMIVHCAGSGSVGFSVKHPYQDYQRTVATTLSVLEFVRLQKAKASVVYPSSAAVYGVVDSLPISEDIPLRPASPYGVHKKLAEELCASYGRHFGVKTIAVRLFSIYGAGLQKQLFWDTCSKIRNNDVCFGGTGRETRDWLHVKDAVELLFISEKHASEESPVINGGSGIHVSIKDIIVEILACFECKTEPQFSGFVNQGDPENYQADISRALDLGWKPKIKWQQGVAEYVECIKKRKL